MRTFRRMLALASIVIMPLTADARRPEPVACPADVAVGLAEACPCSGRVVGNGGSQPWKNHGQYVSCSVHYRNALRKSGCLTRDEKRTIARCAARSTCGKSDVVLCCTAEVGTCSDPVPGDLTAAGTCSNDTLLACDTDADCTKVTGALTSDASACTASGGTVGEGSVCSGCLVP